MDDDLEALFLELFWELLEDELVDLEDELVVLVDVLEVDPPPPPPPSAIIPPIPWRLSPSPALEISAMTPAANSSQGEAFMGSG